MLGGIILIKGLKSRKKRESFFRYSVCSDRALPIPYLSMSSETACARIVSVTKSLPYGTAR